MNLPIEHTAAPVILWQDMHLPASAAALSRCGWLESWEADERDILPDLPDESDVRAAETAWAACSELMLRPANREPSARFAAWLKRLAAYAPTMSQPDVFVEDATVLLSGYPLNVLEDARLEAIAAPDLIRLPHLGKFKSICDRHLWKRMAIGRRIQLARKLRDESTKRLRQWLSSGVTNHPEVRSLMAQLRIADIPEGRRLCGLE